MKFVFRSIVLPLTFLAGLLGTSFAANAPLAAPAPTAAAAATDAYRIVGYMPDWAGDVTAIQYSKLTHICYAFLQANSNGSLDLSGVTTSRLQQLTSRAHASGTKVLISLGGWSNGAALTAAMRNSGARSTLITNCLNFINQFGLDGLDFDWEGPASASDGTAYQAFMQAIYNSLHPQGKLTTTAIAPWFGDNISASSFAFMDFANLMAYDNEGAQHSDFNFAVSNMNYWVGRGLPLAKCVLGVPFYGYSDAAHTVTVAYNTLCARDPNAQNVDFSGGVFYNGIPTIRQKTNYVVSRSAGGVMMWELSQDATGSKSLLSAIYSVLSSTTPVVTYSLSTSPGANGSISPASATVNQGASQTFSITANAGYRVNTVTVDGTNVGAVTSYTFNNVQAPHTLGATFTLAPVDNSSNLARGKTVTASSIETPDFPAALAVDGNAGTRWSSAAADPSWITIDLGAAMPINRVVLKWEAAYGKAYQIQTSPNNQTWTTVYTQSSGSGGVESLSFATTTARYIRMNGTARGTVWGYSLWEFEVYQDTTSTAKVITASAGANGRITPSGSVTVAAGSNQTFTLTPNANFLINSVVVDGANVGAVSSYTFSNVQTNHTISASFTAAPTNPGTTPLSGTAYGWSQNPSATSNNNRVALPGLNDGNLTADIDLQPAGDAVNQWEAAGVIFPNPVAISSVKFINGTVTSLGDGYLEASARLQYSVDGATWVDSNWSISPAYPYNNTAGGKTYTFGGTTLSGIRGVRVSGQVRVKDGSYHWIVKEIQITGSTGG